MHILVTGASGFVGRALVEHLASLPEHQVRAAVRTPARFTQAPAGVSQNTVADLSARHRLAGSTGACRCGASLRSASTCDE